MTRSSNQSRRDPVVNGRSAPGMIVKFSALLVGLAALVGLIAFTVVAVLG